MSDRLDLKKYIRNVNDFPIPGIKFRDITSLIENPEPTFENFVKNLDSEKRLSKLIQAFAFYDNGNFLINNILKYDSLKEIVRKKYKYEFDNFNYF